MILHSLNRLRLRLGLRRANWCPKCGREQHFRCGDPTCVCNRPLPKGQQYQIYTDDGEGLSCPYCGFTRSGCYWEDREVTYCLPDRRRRTLVYYWLEWRYVRTKYLFWQAIAHIRRCVKSGRHLAR